MKVTYEGNGLGRRMVREVGYRGCGRGGGEETEPQCGLRWNLDPPCSYRLLGHNL
jgi:hypothetical protein